MLAKQDMDSLRIQADVIGALVLRELHTRFGRENIGYLWIFGEPLLLAIAVAALHSNQHVPLAGNVRSIPFAFSGYTLFIMFRSMVSRAETLLEANRPLLNHRRVTLLDMLIARASLEICSTIAVLGVLLAAANYLGFADWPADFLLVGAAVALLAGFSFGLSMVVTFLSHESPVASRLVHPLLYLSLPVSGAFFSMEWFNPQLQSLLAWVPTVPIFELMRVGLFEGYSTDHAGIAYPMAWCASLILVGLASLRFLRPRIHIA